MNKTTDFIYKKFTKSKLSDSIIKQIPKKHRSFIFDDFNEKENVKILNTSSCFFQSFYNEDKNKNYHKQIDKANGKMGNNNQTSNRPYEWRGKNNSQMINSFKYKNIPLYTDNNTLLELNNANNSEIKNSHKYVNESNENTENIIIESNEKKSSKGIKNYLNNQPVSTVHNNKINDSKSENFSFKPINIKMIYKINEKLKCDENDPLWYVFNSVSAKSIGPLSSTQLYEMYINKIVDGEADIRLIDKFKLSNNGAYTYFKLKEVENPNFLKLNINSTNLIKNVKEINRKEDLTLFEKKPGEVIKTICKNLPYTESMVNIENKDSVIDKELNIEDNKIKKKQVKIKGKGKLIELDAKTGFFTLSEQEKNYFPIYICGKLENN